MPTYVYRREDGSTFEIEQKITEDPLETCPETGQKVKRQISGGSFHLKGSGFYETDYVRNNDSDSSNPTSTASGEATGEASENGSSSESEASTTESATTNADAY